MANVTLIGEKQAVKGNEFIYLGSIAECKDCKVKTVCFNLEDGKRYRITKVRSMHHDCKIHEGGVRAVEYEVVPLCLAVESSAAVEGATITFEKPTCDNRECDFYSICSPAGVKRGWKYKITEVGEPIECAEKLSLTKVTLGERLK